MKKLFAMAVLIAASCSLQPAIAQGYAGAAFGQSKAPGACTAGLTCDTSSQALRAFGGYTFGPHFAVEGSYADLGKATLSAGNATATVKTAALDVAAVGLVPLGARVMLAGKAGLYSASTKAGSNVGIGGSANNIGTTFGLGVRYALTPAVSLRAEFQRYMAVGNDSIGKSDVDTVTLGAAVRF
jgi:OmpA-OmpF porin, OOP family